MAVATLVVGIVAFIAAATAAFYAVRTFRRRAADVRPRLTRGRAMVQLDGSRIIEVYNAGGTAVDGFVVLDMHGEIFQGRFRAISGPGPDTVRLEPLATPPRPDKGTVALLFVASDVDGHWWRQPAGGRIAIPSLDSPEFADWRQREMRSVL
jgi:hypothetical protein